MSKLKFELKIRPADRFLHDYQVILVSTDENFSYLTMKTLPVRTKNSFSIVHAQHVMLQVTCF